MFRDARTLVQHSQQPVIWLQIERSSARTPQHKLVAARTVSRGVHEDLLYFLRCVDGGGLCVDACLLGEA